MKRDSKTHLASGQPARHERRKPSGGRSLARTAAFTLIEMVGALAIIAILASITAPVVVKQVDKAARTKEISDLSAISNAIVLEAVRNKSVSNQSGWAQAAASWMDLPAIQILNNPRGVARAFVIDPAFQIGGSGLPYTQTTAGPTNRPANTRVMILSSLGAPLPVASGVLSATAFNDIWNTPKMTRPSTWSSVNGEDLVIQRINFESLFYRLILVNRTTNNAATFSIDNFGPQVVPPPGEGGWDRYYLDSTLLSLNSITNPLTTLIKRDASYAFENGAWQDQIVNPPPNQDLTRLFALNANLFLNLPGTSPAQQAQVSAMLDLMLDYTMSTNSTASSLGARQMMGMQILAITTNMPPTLSGLLNDVLTGLGL